MGVQTFKDLRVPCRSIFFCEDQARFEELHGNVSIARSFRRLTEISISDPGRASGDVGYVVKDRVYAHAPVGPAPGDRRYKIGHVSI